MVRSLLVLSLLLMACASLGGQREREYYMTRQPLTLEDSTTLPAHVNLVERVLFQSNANLQWARWHGREEVGCFPVRGDGEEFWINGWIEPAKAYIREHDGVTGVTCPNGYGLIHYHPFDTNIDGGAVIPCQPSQEDVRPEYSFVPVFLIACGYGIDSLIAYRVRNR